MLFRSDRSFVRPRKIWSRQEEVEIIEKPNPNFPFTVWAKLMRTVIADYGEGLLQASPSNGVLTLRRAIADFLYRYRGMNVDESRIIIGSGAEHLYGLIVGLIGREKVYGVENPSYEKIAPVYKSCDARVTLLDSKHSGIDRLELEQVSIDILHVTPSHNFSTGEITPASKRSEYLAYAHKKDIYVVEDDFDSEFRQAGKTLESLYSMDDGEKVIYVNTFSKTIAPALRIGYMVLPPPLMEKYSRQFGFYS